MVHADLVGQEGGVVRAEEGSAVGVDADAEVSHPDFQLSPADDIRYGGCNARVDLRRAVRGRVGLVVEGYEEDAWDERGGGGAAG